MLTYPTSELVQYGVLRSMPAVAPSPEGSPEMTVTVHARSRAQPSSPPAIGSAASSVRKSQEDPQMQPQPQQLCRHQSQHHHQYDQYRQQLEISGLNSLTNAGTTTTTTFSPSPSPPSSYPTDSSLLRTHPIELVQRPETAYFSPYRARPSHFLSTTSSVTLNECCAPSKLNTTTTQNTMGLTKSQRIGILLAIDSIFFLIELVIGELHCGP